MTDPTLAYATSLIPNEGHVLQADLAAYVRDAVAEWMADVTPGLLIEQDYDPRLDAVLQRNDNERKAA